MAGITIKMNLEDSGSIVKKTNDTKTLNKELEKTTRLASQALAQPKGAAFVAAETQEYGRGRAAVGTGAAARDFANQAQGLGGLVRLYATYAANLFAATAAFNALREAMNTDMMVRGLDQLGASSGVALGGLAKQFVQVTDGAISLRESMEATTKAISSGLSTAQFLELGKVAKGASQALGVNMSDAVSRLTRGITKLEPELLDELGIFTKVGQAAEQYAKSVGKSVTSLTDFERRQAFANAVLEEGRQKFGEIAMEGNPYDKLLANLKNVAQDILSVVNTVVAPIAKLLADNIGLIGLAIAAAGVKIVSQALPAIRSWQDGLKDAAQAAKARALEVSESFGAQWVLREEARQDIPRLKSVEVDQTKELEALDRQRVKTASELDNRQIGYRENAKTLAILKTKEALTEQQINALLVQKTKLDSGTTERQKAQLAAIEARLALEKQSLAVQQAISATQQKIKSAYDIVGQKAEQESFDDVLRRRITEQATAEKARLDILSKVSDDVEKKGFRAAVGELYSETAASKDLNRFQKFRTAAVGTISAVTTQAGLILSAFSNVTAYLQIAVVGFTLLSSIFSKASKELSEFNTQIEAGEEAAKTATNTLEKYGSALTIQSINARATAFETLSNSIDLSAKKANDARNAFSWFDKTTDFLKDFVNLGIRDTFSAGLSSQIVQAIQLIPEEDVRKSLEEKVSKALNIKVFSKENIEAGLEAAGSITEIIDKANEIKVLLAKGGRQLLDTRAITQDLLDNEKALADKLKEATKPKADPFLESLQLSLKAAKSLTKAFDDISSGVLAANELISGKLNSTLMVLASNNKEAISEINNLRQIDNDIQAARSRIEGIKSNISVQSREAAKEEAYRRFGIAKDDPGADVRYIVNDLAKSFEKAALETNTQLTKEIALRDKLLAERRETAERLQAISEEAVNSIRSSIVQVTTSAQTAARARSTVSAIEQLPVRTFEGIEERRKAEIRLIEAETASQIAVASQTTAVEKNTIALNNLSDNLELERLKTQLAGRNTETQATLIMQRIADIEKGLFERSGAARALEKPLNQAELDKLFKAGKISETLYSSQSNINLQRTQRAIKIDETNRKAQQDASALQFSRAQESNKDLQDSLTNAIARLGTSIAEATEESAIRGLSESKRAAEDLLAQAQRDAIKLQTDKEQRDLAILGKAGISKPTLEATSGAIGEKAEREQARLGDTQTQTFASAAANRQKEIKSLQERFSVEQLSFANREADISLQQQQLENAKALGSISEREYLTKKNALEVSKINLDTDKEIASLRKQQKDELAGIDRLIGQSKDADEIEALKTLRTASEGYYASAIANAEKLSQARKSGIIDLTDEQKRMQEFATGIQKLFEGMGDALADFVLTGKGNFKDLVNSILADLLRLEMRRSFTNLLDSFGGASGIAKSILGAFTPVATPIVGAPVDSSIIGGPVRAARGAAFDEGLMRFAKGGAFTNEVVNTPTQFKFAQGAGVMGEAGPEAIMPLARDSSGNLGVRANGGGGNVEVVVNNYSTEKAEARETVDSRGNRRIEVVVGEMVASEVTRSNSAVNKSIRGSFATQPNLIRR